MHAFQQQQTHKGLLNLPNKWQCILLRVPLCCYIRLRQITTSYIQLH